MKWCIYGILLVLAASCTPHREKERVEKPQERIISRDEALGGIPCFKCHSYQKFSTPVKGTFPHGLHRETGYHCNQGHSIKGHSAMKTRTDACTGCHSLKGFSYTSSGLPVHFNHESHAKPGCRECHPGTFQMKKNTSRMTMDALYQGKYCGLCHNGKRSFASTECTRCHEMKAFKKAISYKVESIGNVSFSHEFHTQVFTCDNCHPAIFSMKRTKMTMDPMYGGKYCGVCHNGEKASAITDCGKCHRK